MPQLGEVRIGREIGYKTGWEFIWSACCDCGKERWVRKDWDSKRCKPCAGKDYTKKYSGANSRAWKGGRNLNGNGYVQIRLSQDDFFFAMCTKKGYVMEHRLVMAKHLGRNLHSWEIVHHKNHIRRDNRIENLQLVSDDRHKQLTILENRIRLLEQRVTLLEAENILLKQEAMI